MRWILLVPAFALFFSDLARALPTPNRDAATAQLLAAVKRTDLPAVRAALNAGAEVNGPQGPTALFAAVQFKNDEATAYKIVEELLKHGADINARGPDGMTVLHVVLTGRALCSPRVSALLADYHPNLNFRDIDGRGVVALSLRRGPVAVVTKDAQGKPVKTADWYYCARKFLEAGAPADVANADGITPLMSLSEMAFASDSSPVEFIKLLLAKGADPSGATGMERAPSITPSPPATWRAGPEDRRGRTHLLREVGAVDFGDESGSERRLLRGESECVGEYVHLGEEGWGVGRGAGYHAYDFVSVRRSCACLF